MFTTITGSGFNATPLAEYSGDIEGGVFSWSTANLIGAELFFLSSTISSGLARPIRPRATYRGAFISPWRCFVSRRSNFKKNRSLLRDKIRATISEHAQFSSSRGHHVSPLERKSSGVVRVSGHRFTGGGRCTCTLGRREIFLEGRIFSLEARILTRFQASFLSCWFLRPLSEIEEEIGWMAEDDEARLQIWKWNLRQTWFASALLGDVPPRIVR